MEQQQENQESTHVPARDVVSHWLSEDWIAEEFRRIESELRALRAIKRPNSRDRQATIFFQQPSEVVKAAELGIVSRAEARKILGVKGKVLPRVPRRK